jgi:hypothetical protein
VSYTKIPPEKIEFPITVDGTKKTVEIKAVSGKIELLEDGNGYTFERGAAWQASYAWFGIDLGSAKLSDFGKVNFKYQGVSGDIGYKSIALVASPDPFSGSLGSDANVTSKTVNVQWWNEGDKRFYDGPQVNGTTAKDVSFTISKAKSDVYNDKSTVYFSIFFNANVSTGEGESKKSTTFTISDIEFVKESGAVNIQTTANIDRILVKSPTQTEYIKDVDKFDTTGMVVTAIYLSDELGYGKELAATDYSLTGATVGTEFDTVGDKTITIAYSGKSATFTIKVIGAAVVLPDGFFKLGAFYDGTKSWATDGVEGASDLTEGILASAKYFIALMHTDSLNGIGDLQFHHQGGTDSSWTTHQITVTTYVNIQALDTYGANMDFYIIIKLDTLADWDKTSGGGGAKVILNWPAGWSDGNATFKQGYFYSKDLVKPSSKTVDVANSGTTYGWFAVDVPELTGTP